MAVAFDALTESSAFTADTTFNHTPVGTPKGVLVFIGQNGASGDEIDSVTYGGQALTFVAAGTDTNVELMRAECWFLGTGIPTGTQTVAVNETGGTSKIAYCITVTAAADTEVEGSNTTGENQANPSVVITTGASVETYVAALLMSGLGVVGDVAAGAGFTLLDQNDLGQQTMHLEDIDTNDAGGNVTAAFTSVSDDVAMVAVAVKESAGGGTTHNGAASMSLVATITTAALRIATAAASLGLVFNAATTARRTTFASATTSLTFNAATVATRSTFAAASTSLSFNVATAATRKTFASSSTSLVFNAATVGTRTTFGASSSTYLFNISSQAAGGPVLGSASLSLQVGIATVATRTAMAASSSTYTVGIATAANRTTFASVSLPIVFGITTVGTGPSVTILPAGEPGYIADYGRGHVAGYVHGRIDRTVAGRIT